MAVFLSHSGKQKDFAYILHSELLRTHRTCFFDRDTKESLPSGDLIPETILESINACQLGVVVLSQDFITSVWPMAELENLISAKKRIYPVFHGLKPSDLVKEKNLQRWEKEWKQIGSSEQKKSIPSRKKPKMAAQCLPFDISKWKGCLSTVRLTAGSEFDPASDYMDPFIKHTLVPQICDVCPPHLVYYCDDTFIKGRQRMAQEVEDNFQKLISSVGKDNKKLFVLGLHGMGGIGKTTLCKTMIDYYNQIKYNGVSCLFELPTQEVGPWALLPKLKEVLKRLTHITKEALDDITDFDQGISALKQRIQGRKCFLAIDNVWEWSYKHVKKILHCLVQHNINIKGDIRVMVTGRDKDLLENILIGIEELHHCITCVPCMNQEEAWDLLKQNANYFTSHYEVRVRDIIGRCIFNKSCNPFVIDLICRKLGRTNKNHEKVLKDCLDQLQGKMLDDDSDERVLSFAMEVYENLDKSLQNIFMNTILLDQDVNSWKEFSKCWLRILANFDHDVDIVEKLKELESHGLLRISYKKDFRYEIESYIKLEMHDLFIEVRRRATIKRGFYLFSHGLTQPQDVKHVSVVLQQGRWMKEDEKTHFLSKLGQCSADNLKLVHVECSDLLYNSDDGMLKCLNVVDWLNSITGRIQQRDHNQSNLRILSMSCDRIEKITGLHSLPNLIFLHLYDCYDLKELHDINHLHKLQELHVIAGKRSLTTQVVPNLSSCSNLRRLTLKKCSKLKRLAELGCPPSLEVIDLCWCRKLVDLEGLESLKSLRVIRLDYCFEVEEFPAVILPKLRVLKLSCCRKLRRVMEGVDGWDSHLPSLEVLDLSFSGSGKENQEVKLHLGGKTLNALRVLSCMWNDTPFTVKLERSYRLNTNLEVLALDNLDTTTDTAQALSASFAALESLPGLSIGFKSLPAEENHDGTVFNNLSFPQNLERLLLVNFPGTLLKNLALVGNTLISLTLDGCSQLKELPNLTSLDKLESLTLHRCESLILKLEHLICFTNLIDLSIVDCKLINIEKTTLKNFLPKCDIKY